MNISAPLDLQAVPVPKYRDMASCEFPITFHQPLKELTDRFQRAITTKGGHFSGDGKGGEFTINSESGTINGKYTVEANVFHFSLPELPEEITCHKAENTFRSLIGSPPDLSLDFA